MTVNELRSKYLEFFRQRGHRVIPSVSLVPENDPTTLFVSSGMQPLLPYFLGIPHPMGSRVTNSQKSLRTQDIEEVGDNRHTTFFEMLGNWSFGDYFKAEQLPWFFEFLTDVVGLDPARLYVTTFIGDESLGIPRDTGSAEIWKKLFSSKGVEAKDVALGSEENGGTKGMQGGRIFYYDAKKNWWSRAGAPSLMPAGEPGGPDSEVFYDFDPTGVMHDVKFGKECHPNCDCGRFMEIGNSVFMEYIKKEDGSFEPLPNKNVDFGGGLERIAAAREGGGDVFLLDAFTPLISVLEKAGTKKYKEATKSFRVVLDHIRAATFMLGDGVTPSNTERGYIARRLIRRAVRHVDVLGAPQGTLALLATAVIEYFKEHYPELKSAETIIQENINIEEDKFRKTLTQGMREFEKLSKEGPLRGEDAFTLFTTFGFPFEVTEELAKERGLAFDSAGFKQKMEEHQKLSRAGAAQKFAGGLADHSEQTVRYHTTHHILLKALQVVLGPEVHQRGSNITSERLRIDFSYPTKMTPEQKAEVEKIVNEKIAEKLPVMRTVMPKGEAEKFGAEHEFGVKYPEMVSVYSVGPKGAVEGNPQIESAFSIEFCGGPHVNNTQEIGDNGRIFKIQKEEAVASGVRRIKAVLV
ncbi:MAG: Alanine--tRNA ligase [Parcubacteria group bacterium Greene0714_7]|nr:MAG: Alanine--tRNA ligase [Parcubacteria group bacterium Greene0714_7]